MSKKKRVVTTCLLLTALLLLGCAAVQEALPTDPTEGPRLFIVEEPKEERDPKIYALEPTEPGRTDIPEESVPMAQSPEDLIPSPENPLTQRQAEALAIYHAGLEHQDVRFLFSKIDYEDGIPVIEVSFISGKYSYEYEFATETGEIRSFEKESILDD